MWETLPIAMGRFTPSTSTPHTHHTPPASPRRSTRRQAGSPSPAAGGERRAPAPPGVGGTRAGSGPAGAAALGRPLLAPSGAAGALCSQRGGSHARRWCVFIVLSPSREGMSASSSVPLRPPAFDSSASGSAGARGDPHTHTRLPSSHLGRAGFALRPAGSVFPEVQFAEDAEQQHEKLCPLQKKGTLTLPS